jgi:hypothetical protein
VVGKKSEDQQKPQEQPSVDSGTQPERGDIVGSDPKDTSETLKPVEPPDPSAPTAPDSTEETGDTPKVSGERAETTKVKGKADDDKAIADAAIAKAKEEERERSDKFRDDLKEHEKNVNEVFHKQDDLGDVEYKDREVPPAEQAVLDVLEEAQRHAGESVKAAQATVAATALARMGVEATLDASNPGEPVALSNQRQELVDKVSRAVAELDRYDQTAPKPVDMGDANLDTLAVVGPDQTQQPDAPSYQPKKRTKPEEVVNGIIDKVIELSEGGGHDYYTARKLLQTVERRLGARWAKHRDKSKAKRKEQPSDPNHHVNPVDGSGQRFNTYADSAGMVGDKQIGSPEYMVPFQAPEATRKAPEQATVGSGE